MKAAKRNNTRLITMEEFLDLPQQPAAAVLKAEKPGKYGMLCRSSADGRAPLLLEDAGNRQWSSNCMIDRCYYVREEQPGGGYHIDFSARADMKDVCSNLEIRLVSV